MKYFAHIFIGKEFAEIASNIGEQVIKCGGGKYFPSINLFLVDGQAIRQITYPKEPVSVKQVATKADLGLSWREVCTLTGKMEEDASAFRTEIFNQIINIQNVGIAGELNVVFHLPLYKADVMKRVASLYSIFKATQKPVTADFIGYCDDLACVLEPEYKIVSPSKKQVREYVRFKEEQKLSFDNHFIAIQNSSQGGIALNLNKGSFAAVMGYFALLCTEHYTEIFPNTIEYRDVVALGMSLFSLDKYLYAEYLLNKAILNAMDQKSVNGNNINVNTAYRFVDPIFSGKEKLLSTLFKEIDRQSKHDEDAEFPTIDEKFKAEIQEIIKRRNDVLKEQEAITMQAAILAVCLAQSDCELFADTIFSQNSVTFDKLFNEPINYFIDNDRAQYYKIGEELPVNPIQEISELDIKLVNSEAQIRAYKEQIDSYETEIEESEKATENYVEDGFFHFQNKKFRLLPSVKQELLEETYTAHEVTVESVDLRPKFTKIKNQGQQGSCLAFTLTSIFEYVMKLNRPQNPEEWDLSEAFLYYNARNIDSTGDLSAQTDTGSRFKPAIESLKRYGIALETVCRYDDKEYDKKPSQEAYDDAAKRKVVMAMNVRQQVDDIKSALVDGCPVAGSFVLTKSFFDMKGGYVTMPDDEEIAASEQPENEQHKHGHHAMVIVGFSDELKAFIVRNSWGEDWGEQGYCFMPYAYIENEKLFDFACVITEIENLQAKSTEAISPLRINTNDLDVKRMIAQNSLREEQQKVIQMRQRKVELRAYFEVIKDFFCNANGRDAYIAANREKIEEEKIELRECAKAKELEHEQNDSAFNKYKKSTLVGCTLFTVVTLLLSAFWWQTHSAIWGKETWSGKTFFAWGLIFLALFVVAVISRKKGFLKSIGLSFGAIAGVLVLKFICVVLGVFGSNKGFIDYFGSIESSRWDLGWVWLVILFGGALTVVFFKSRSRWEEWREERHRIDNAIEGIRKQINAKEREKQLFKLKTFSAWSLLSKFHILHQEFHTHYTQLVALMNNLRAWYKTVDQQVDECSVDGRTPDISMLDKVQLDAFFEEHLKNDSGLKIDFCEEIAKLGNAPDAWAQYREAVIEKTIDNLMGHREIANFDMTEHLVHDRFIAIAKPVDRELINALKEKSGIFLEVKSLDRPTITPSELVFAPSVTNNQSLLAAKLKVNPSEMDDKYRLIYLQTATLSFNECVNLRFE